MSHGLYQKGKNRHSLHLCTNMRPRLTQIWAETGTENGSLLKEKGMGDVLVIGGGVIPDADIPGLKKAGVAAVFTPGTPTSDIVNFIKENVK